MVMEFGLRSWPSPHLDLEAFVRDSDGNLPPLAGTKETVNTASRLSVERTRHQVFRDVADLRVNLLTMVNDCSVNQKLARAMISTATVLEEEVIQVKKENAPFGSPRMTALVDRIKRLKGISPMRINEFATELNWSTTITQATPAETKGSPELVVEGPASSVNDNKVYSDPTSCEFDPGDIGHASFEVEPVLAVTASLAHPLIYYDGRGFDYWALHVNLLHILGFLVSRLCYPVWSESFMFCFLVRLAAGGF
ncbi:hypothetical protein U1Q18_037801 [Sarracenia purpurea var. burkii]